MGVTRIDKPLTTKGKRFLESRSAKLLENDKQMVVLRATSASDTVLQFMRDVTAMKRPLCRLLNRRRHLLPFEDALPLERIAHKMDASLFLIGSHSKKRPHNLVLGRLFDGNVLDLVELGLTDYKSLRHFCNAKVAAGTKPCLLFNGFSTTDDTHVRLQSLLLDVFRGVGADSIRLAGLELVLQFTAREDGSGFLMRTYRCSLRSAAGGDGSVTPPRVHLTEIGPSAELVVRRTRLASDDLYRRSLKQPKQLRAKKPKNVSAGNLGTQLGRLHMVPQDLTKLATRKLKGLKKTPEERADERKELVKT